MEREGGGVWRPIRLTDKATGRIVNISILDREMYLAGFFTFDDLWQMYNSDHDTEQNPTTKPTEGRLHVQNRSNSPQSE